MPNKKKFGLESLAAEMAADDKRHRQEMKSILNPPASLLCKLGSILVHAEEATSSDGHHFDMIALRGLINDAEVSEWRNGMAKAAFLPVKRKT